VTGRSNGSVAVETPDDPGQAFLERVVEAGMDLDAKFMLFFSDEIHIFDDVGQIRGSPQNHPLIDLLRVCVEVDPQPRTGELAHFNVISIFTAEPLVIVIGVIATLGVFDQALQVDCPT
jgi:hypothetical protein